MTPEEKAQIARENGAKSKGPVTDEGKARSSRNALKTGEHADIFKHFVPPHEACVCIEERAEYAALVEQLLFIYKPKNLAANTAVGDIAAARWQIERLKRCITMTWNLALATNGARPNNYAPELHEIKAMVDATAEILAGSNALAKLNREIDRLQQSIARAERRIKFLHTNFPDIEKGTNQTAEPGVENKPLIAELPENLPTPVYTTESTPKVIAGYKKDFPGRPIVILPAKTEETDADDYDDLGPVPRKVA